MLALLCTFPITLRAQTSPAQAPMGRVVLVLPFENRSGDPSLDWMGESFPATLNQRFTSAGFLTITRDDRLFAYDHLGLPLDFKPTHATTIRLAQTLDADFVVLGSFTTSNGRINAQAQLVHIDDLRLDPPLNDSAELERLLDLENSIAWKLARQMDPTYSVALQTFLAASSGLRLEAFEHYIRGLNDSSADDRLKHLQTAVQLQPGYSSALLALGKAQFEAQKYDEAAATFSKFPADDALSLEAHFYLGLSDFYTVNYARAEAAFAFVASRLPLAEVINNQAVAASRQNKDASALFLQATNTDPQDADYHFNLAVSLRRRRDFTGALREAELALKFHSSDTEALQLQTTLQREQAAGSSATLSAFSPLERIRRTYTEAGFRQAAFQLDEVRAQRMANLPAAQQAVQLTQLGADYLAQGLILEAEREFQTAIAIDNHNAAAHAGLAAVRERSGSAEEARKQAGLSLQIKPNVAAYLVLARLDLQAGNLAVSAASVSNALHLEPGNGPAIGMKQALEARGQQVP